eukprot:CAMPEP_0185854428 /NCGR_PEP_ID=MMETSP1354-20130828/22306_1 /TAXON_ID=708628 /ORGANISM="Erythrolobus madagascarensis, Strain CCMP3276" /LENGTH=72 /DNA_ID=CAMNT_0028556183 /DNA_START=1 /DNA_END=215 /DNA_ORIENTATION=+
MKWKRRRRGVVVGDAGGAQSDGEFEALRMRIEEYLAECVDEGVEASSDDLRYTTLKARGRPDLVEDVLANGG